MPKQIFFFGSSMNPPTRAHIAIVQYFSQRFPDAKILVAPVYMHAFSSKKLLADYADRFNMANLAFKELQNVEVSNIEALVNSKLIEEKTIGSEIPIKVGTIDVLIFLQAANPNSKINLILGYDTARDLLDGKWKGEHAIIVYVNKIYVLARNDATIKHADIPEQYQTKFEETVITYADPIIMNCSSTKARAGDTSCVTETVLEYMLTTALYNYGHGKNIKRLTLI